MQEAGLASGMSDILDQRRQSSQGAFSAAGITAGQTIFRCYCDTESTPLARRMQSTWTQDIRGIAQGWGAS
jgi:hypothetical protein